MCSFSCALQPTLRTHYNVYESDAYLATQKSTFKIKNTLFFTQKLWKTNNDEFE